tara:strand:- start:128 stop:307 length:180 start_codon:yes stop_codon:yes gene_type:complete
LTIEEQITQLKGYLGINIAAIEDERTTDKDLKALQIENEKIESEIKRLTDLNQKPKTIL